MSIMPRRLRPGGDVTVHLGVVNRKRHPLVPYVRVTIIDPLGVQQRLFQGTLWVFPNYFPDLPLLEQRKRMANFYYRYHVPANGPLGCYRVKIENFCDGVLYFSDNLETDFFHVEDLELVEVTEAEKGFRAVLRNLSPEPVPITVMEPASDESGEFHEETVEVPAEDSISLSFARRPTFVRFAGTQVLHLAVEDTLCLRNPRFFWRDEDEETVYVLDPRAELKRKFFLRGDACEIWRRSNGARRRAEIRVENNAETYDQLVKKELVLEVEPCSS